MLTVVDYGRGNLFSIGQALKNLGYDFIITQDPQTVSQANQILLPGVGAFGDAMANLKQNGMDVALKEAAGNGAQLLGICLGMQLLANSSEEFGNHDGLGLIEGRVKRLSSPEDDNGTRIPNVGWRRVAMKAANSKLNQLTSQPFFYFVHSYAFHCSHPSDISGTIFVNGEDIPVIVGRDNVWGMQFHPEKSGPAGLQILDLFLQSHS